MNLKFRNFKFVCFSVLLYLLSSFFAAFEKLEDPYCGFACYSRWLQIMLLLSLTLLIVAVLRELFRGGDSLWKTLQKND